MSRFDLSHANALVTGGSGAAHGVGRSVALALARAGANVAVNGRNLERAEAVAESVRSVGPKGIAVAADVTDPDQVEQMVNETVAALGSIDILVNCVGRASIGKPELLSPADWVESISVNLNSTFFCCAAAGRIMIQQGAGRIINIASTAGIQAADNMPHYAAAKAGVINLTRSLALAWSEHNINVNCVTPGRIEVPAHPVPGLDDEELEKRRQQSGAGTALQQPAQTDDIANAVVFLASPAAIGISGESTVIRGAEWASVYA